MNKRKKKKERKERVEITEEMWNASPRARFLNTMARTFQTPDHRYFFYTNQGDRLVEEPEVLAVLYCDWAVNRHFGENWSRLNAVHIRSIGVQNEMRGMGIFNSICSLLISFAEETGCFLHFTAKPFAYDIGKLRNTEDCYEFIQNEYKQSDTMRRSKETDQRGLELKKAYLRNGFCDFTHAGYGSSDPYWTKRCSLGYLGREPQGEKETAYFARHLRCVAERVEA